LLDSGAHPLRHKDRLKSATRRYGRVVPAHIRRRFGRRGVAVAGALVVVLLFVPAGALAASEHATRSTATVIEPGAGFRSPAGSTAVRRVQRRLRALGYSPGPLDGRYGRLTQNAVLRFQRASGIAVDGVAGPQTQGLLSHPALERGTGYDLPDGSPLVRRLQTRLRSAGADPGRIDGVYGPVTEAAVMRFQRRAAIAVDGVAGAQTMRALLAHANLSASSRSVKGRAVHHPSGPAQAPTPVAGDGSGWSAWLSVIFLVASVAALALLAVWLQARLAQLVRWVNRRVAGKAPRHADAGERALGFVSVLPYASGADQRRALDSQEDAIEAACRRRDWRLVEVVRDFDSNDPRGVARPPLAYTLDLLAAGEASSLVVTGFDRLARSSAELITLMDRLIGLGAHLVATEPDLDTRTSHGEMVARVLIAMRDVEPAGLDGVAPRSVA
jgi:peptidoglycan hydrolase-like protein with peptidoglycan-binding domain